MDIAASSELDAIRRGADRSSPAPRRPRWPRSGRGCLLSRSGAAGRPDVRRVLTHPRTSTGTLSAETLPLLAILRTRPGRPPTAGGLLSGSSNAGRAALCGSGGPDVSCPDGHAAVDRACRSVVDSVALPTWPARHRLRDTRSRSARTSTRCGPTTDRPGRRAATEPGARRPVSKALVGSIDTAGRTTRRPLRSAAPGQLGWDDSTCRAADVAPAVRQGTVHADRLPDSTDVRGWSTLVDHAWQRVAGRTRADGES